MSSSTINFLPVIPEIFVFAMACITLLIGLFFHRVKHLSYYLAQITLIIAAVLTICDFIYWSGGQTVFTFDDSFVFDRLAVILKEFIYLASFMSFWYAHQYNDEHRIPAQEFYVLGLLSTLGMMVVVSAHDLINLYLGLELLSLPIYSMIALQRAKIRCIEAAMKYFVFGSVASGLLLYGMSLVFGATKSLDVAYISKIVASTPITGDLILLFGMVFIIGGLAFKIGAAPFHMWVPDVYDGSPNSATVFLSSAPRLAAFGLIIRLLVETLPGLHVEWTEIWIAVAVISIVLGNIVAIVQTNIKRMLAYSSIAHMGYMILGLSTGTSRGDAAALFYMISYTLMTLGAFGMLTIMSRGGFEVNEIRDFSGLNTRNAWLAFMMLILMFSMAGVPPLIGFIAKVGIFEALIKAHMVWLAVFAIVFAIIGSYYYLQVVKVMYFEESKDITRMKCPLDTTIAVSLNCIAVLLLGIFPGALFSLSHLTF